MTRTAYAEINLSALRHNYALARRQLPHTHVWAVVKSNGYGHGLLRVAQALPDADGFALINLDDALALRHAGIGARILLLEGAIEARELEEAAAWQLDVVVRSEHQLQWLRACGQPLRVWVKVNTGMNRFGFVPERAIEVVAELRALGCEVAGLMTHFACADDLAIRLDAPWQRFMQAVEATALPFTAANSAATLRAGFTHGAAVRLGGLLYNNNPFYPDTSLWLQGLRPVMRFAARIVHTSELAAGDSIGYGAAYTAERPMRIGIVGAGYGDGYPRAAPSGTPVLVNGCRVPLLGRVAMNVLAIDLSAHPEVDIGDEVTLWGDAALPCDEIAWRCGTISEELQCALTSRLPIRQIVADHTLPRLPDEQTAPAECAAYL
ncbi:alanine racemase [Vogesella sp. LIG4]|uniref:alanine racemase n=1 Tax=Vogesella sp. LIG4 TaxID=1192162 RepID=UPI00081F8EEF|nr:alanine racemase [Vogesella sp. LIG4]SCK06844.1 alanine racemase [Vogesella sp. LIG4]